MSSEEDTSSEEEGSSFERYKRLEEARKVHMEAVDDCWDACEAGDLAQVEEIFRTRQLNREDAQWLINASLDEKHLIIARFLLEQGADPKEVSLSILRSADCSLDMLKLLAEFGLDFETIGHEFLPSKVHNREMVDWILDQGADPNQNPESSILRRQQGERDDTVEVLNAAAALGDIETFGHLVMRGANPSRSIALHKATRCKDPALTVAMITHLVEKYYFDVNADDKCGGLRYFGGLGWDPPEYESPLQCAINHENVPAIQVLLRYGADPTPSLLSCAIQRGLPLAAVKLFLKAGADPSVASIDLEWTPMQTSDWRGRVASEAVKCATSASIQFCLEYAARRSPQHAERGVEADPKNR